MGLLVTYLVPVIMGCVCAVLALGRGRSPIWWFLIGTILGWVGLLVLFIIPPAGIAKESDKEEVESLVEVQEARQECSAPFNWFYLDPQKEAKGPCSADELREKWGERVLSKDSWVWNQSIESWKKISEVPFLLEWLEKA